MSVEIYSDTTSDIPQETVNELDINLIPLSVTIKDEPFLDRETIDTPTIIRAMRAGNLPSTASPGDGLIRERFEKVHGKQIVSVFVGQKISAVFDHAILAAKGIYPPPIIDSSETTSMALGFLTIQAARMALDGKSAKEIDATIEALKQRTVAMVVLPTLEWVRRGGRIGHIKGLFGQVLNIKPILVMHEGRLEEVQKIRTWEKAKERFAEIIQSIHCEQAAIMYGDNGTEADWLIGKTPVPTSGEILKIPLGAALMAHAGPEGLVFCGIRTPDSPPISPASLAAV